MQGDVSTLIPRLLLLLTAAACVWGVLAFARLDVELLPRSRERLVVVGFEARGYSATALDGALGSRVTPLFRRHGFSCDVEARFFAHGGTLTCRTPAEPAHAERLARVRVGMYAALSSAGLLGARSFVRDEPLQDRVFLRAGLPVPVNETELSALASRLRALDGIADVTWSKEPSAWTPTASYAVVAVERREHANPVEVSAAARAHLPASAHVFFDEADYVRASEGNLTENIVSGTLLTLVCVLVFLRRLSSTLLVGVSIPLCVMLSIPLLYALGTTRNIMSLAGLALSVGIVVDASLSIVGDFDERMATGRYRAGQAALRTLQDAFSPLMVATISTLAVFVPILFLSGRVGELFSALSQAVIVSNVVGLLVSLLVVPALLASFTRRERPEASGASGASEVLTSLPAPSSGAIKGSLIAGWTRLFSLSAANPMRAGLFLALSFAAVGASLLTLPRQEFLPLPREGRALAELDALPMALDRGGSAQKDHDVRRLFALLPGAQAAQDFSGRVIATFDPRGVPLDEVERRIEHAFPGRPAYVALENPLHPLSAQSSDVTFFIDGSDGALAKLRDWLHQMPGVANVRLSALEGAPEKFDVLDVPHEVSAGAFKETQRRFISPDSPQAAGRIEGAHRVERAPIARVRINGAPHAEGNVKLEGSLTTLAFEDTIATYAKGAGLTLHRSASSREAKESLAGLARCLVLAVVIIFFVLWAQNRSASKSLIILATFAWAPLGAIPALAWHGETLNGSALVGFILLAGTIVNNGILLMDRIEKNIALQMPVFDAAFEGVRDRSLNVVVTGLTTVLAMAPMIWGGQEGSQMYRSLSIVVVYGTIASTPVSFLGIPALLILRQGFVEAKERWRLKRRVATWRTA